MSPVPRLWSLSNILCTLPHVSVPCLPSSIPCLISLFLVSCHLSPVSLDLSSVSHPLPQSYVSVHCLQSLSPVSLDLSFVLHPPLSVSLPYQLYHFPLFCCPIPLFRSFVPLFFVLFSSVSVFFYHRILRGRDFCRQTFGGQTFRGQTFCRCIVGKIVLLTIKLKKRKS
jgi:hypothetical protein